MTETEGLTITRVFKAPRELVFDAWTNPQHFARWFGGKDVDIPIDTVSMDVRPGGSWKATMVLPDGGHQIHWLGEYVEVDPPERLVLTLSDGPEDREVVTVVQYEQAKAGYQTFFDALAELVEA
jgi:uncharacterized protein YndB with AHSA1/START domain